MFNLVFRNNLTIDDATKKWETIIQIASQVK